ncbi:hypothetical protein ACHAXT_008817 [Thalassiosira profunda]
MGFFKKATTSYPAQRNRISQQQQQHHASVNPPAPSYGAYNPSMPSSAYQNDHIPVAPSRPSAVTATAAAFPPNNNAPVMATAAGAATAAPVVATAYNPGSAPSHGAAPVQATVYNPAADAATAPPATAPPATNPMYQTQSASFNNGNASYKSDESAYWECSVCTFPNLRTEPNCKGCGGAIPPGMLYSAASAAVAQQQQQRPSYARPPQDTSYAGMNGVNHAMNNLSVGGGPSSAGAAGGGSSGTMRVHIPNGFGPGQKIKVRSPDGKEVVKAIPPRSEWHYDGSKPFFRMQFGAAAAPPAASVVAGSRVSYGSAPTAQEVPPPHSTSWREFHTRAPSHYDPPPIGSRTVPHSPRGGAGLPPNGRHKALIIGINYHRTRAELRGCINDARNMSDVLQRNGFPNDGSHMLLLTDERSRGREYQPTVQNIMKAFAWFMKDVRRGDVLFFHFSGHGGQVPDKTGHEVDGWNETIIPVDFQKKGQITDDVLWGSLVYKLPEGARITALMDMCHSGTGLDLPYDYNVDRRYWKEDVNPAHSSGDVVLFSGCEDSQTSADVAGMGKQAGGAMTQAFIRAYQSSGMSTYHEFLTAVKRELRKRRFSQRPQLTSSQQFDANNRIFSIGYQSSCGQIPSFIEPNHNPKVGRIKRRHVRPARQGFGGGRRTNDLFGYAGAAIGAALLADALF